MIERYEWSRERDEGSLGVIRIPPELGELCTRNGIRAPTYDMPAAEFANWIMEFAVKVLSGATTRA